MDRPTVVTILAIALFLGIPYLLVAALLPLGGGAFLSGIPILLLSLLNSLVDWPTHALLAFAIALTSNSYVLIGIYCLLALICLVVGVGLLRLGNWARLALAILTTLSLAAGVLAYVSPRLLLFRQSIADIAIEVVVLIYLFRPEAKEAFGATGF